MKASNARTALFGPYSLDLRSGELQKFGSKIKMGEQSFRILCLLLDANGGMVSREELRDKLWATDTFVDFDHGLNSAVQRLRDCLSDSAENPRWIATVPRRGYRFVGRVEWKDDNRVAPAVDSQPQTPEPSRSGEPQTVNEDAGEGSISQLPVADRMNGNGAKFSAGEAALGAQLPVAVPEISNNGASSSPKSVALAAPPVRRTSTLLSIALILLVAAGVLVYTRFRSPTSRAQRALTRLTFEDGLQSGATWSPDGRFIAYSSDRGGKFDIWVRPVSGGDPVQVTRRQGNNWQPAWSPDGKYIAYRSEGPEGGVFIVPALGGEGLERRLAAFGYYPRWSPDGSRILFRTVQFLGVNRFYVVSLDGSEPDEVLKEFTSPGSPMAIEATWHPDGKRISMWVDAGNPGPVPDFWTVPLAGGAADKPETPRDVARQMEGLALEGTQEWASEYAFYWAPSGRALYFPLTLRGAVNLWKMTVDPATLRPTSIERMTTGRGPDAQLALSSDGRKLAFTEEVQHIQTWVFPFDASRGKLTGDGRAVTPVGMAAWRQMLSPDEKRLAFSCGHGGRSEVWEMSLDNSHMAPVVADNQLRDRPLWSPDGKRLAYVRYNSSTHDARLVLWSPETRHEEPIADASEIASLQDWSPDGRELLVSQINNETKRSEIWSLPLAAAPNANAAGTKIISDPEYDLTEQHFSRDGRWIVFQAVRNLPTKLESKLYVVSASGGRWIPVTEGTNWDDKPRWSPNGKMIYFVSGRRGFFNVWGIHFDPTQGRVTGEPFAVTRLESPGLMVPEHIPSVDLSLSQNHLAMTLEQVSGSIWMLEDVSQ